MCEVELSSAVNANYTLLRDLLAAGKWKEAFESQLEEVTEPVFERETVVQIPLQPQQVEAVKEVARSRGINYVDLIQQWILEKVYTA